MQPSLTILGSGAAEGWPALFCTCKVCRYAQEHKGKDVRRRTSYRLGETIQIDWGPDTYGSYLHFGLDTTPIQHVLITHSHEDHWVPHELFYRRHGFSVVDTEQPFHLWCSPQVTASFNGVVPDWTERCHIQLHELGAFETAELEPGITVTPLPANHGLEIGGAYNFLFNVNGKGLIIGNDTGWWADEVWNFLSEQKLDVVVMDCTNGQIDNSSGHLGAPNVVQVKAELEKHGALNEGRQFVANHFSHNGGWLHEELEQFFAPHGIEVGFDGMEINFA